MTLMSKVVQAEGPMDIVIGEVLKTKVTCVGAGDTWDLDTDGSGHIVLTALDRVFIARGQVFGWRVNDTYNLLSEAHLARQLVDFGVVELIREHWLTRDGEYLYPTYLLETRYNGQESEGVYEVS